jgi:hypothetical protein
VIRDSDGGHPELADALAELRQAIGAVEEGVLAVEMKVDEIAGHVRILIAERCPR